MAWALWWAVGIGVWTWGGPLIGALYLIVSGAVGAAFGRR